MNRDWKYRLAFLCCHRAICVFLLTCSVRTRRFKSRQPRRGKEGCHGKVEGSTADEYANVEALSPSAFKLVFFVLQNDAFSHRNQTLTKLRIDKIKGKTFYSKDLFFPQSRGEQKLLEGQKSQLKVQMSVSFPYESGPFGVNIAKSSAFELFLLLTHNLNKSKYSYKLSCVLPEKVLFASKIKESTKFINIFSWLIDWGASSSSYNYFFFAALLNSG